MHSTLFVTKHGWLNAYFTSMQLLTLHYHSERSLFLHTQMQVWCSNFPIRRNSLSLGVGSNQDHVHCRAPLTTALYAVTSSKLTKAEEAFDIDRSLKGAACIRLQ